MRMQEIAPRGLVNLKRSMHLSLSHTNKLEQRIKSHRSAEGPASPAEAPHRPGPVEARHRSRCRIARSAEGDRDGVLRGRLAPSPGPARSARTAWGSGRHSIVVRIPPRGRAPGTPAERPSWAQRPSRDQLSEEAAAFRASRSIRTARPTPDSKGTARPKTYIVSNVGGTEPLVDLQNRHPGLAWPVCPWASRPKRNLGRLRRARRVPAAPGHPAPRPRGRRWSGARTLSSAPPGPPGAPSTGTRRSGVARRRPAARRPAEPAPIHARHRTARLDRTTGEDRALRRGAPPSMRTVCRQTASASPSWPGTVAAGQFVARRRRSPGTPGDVRGTLIRESSAPRSWATTTEFIGIRHSEPPLNSYYALTTDLGGLLDPGPDEAAAARWWDHRSENPGVPCTGKASDR
jgi:hypothetical protein